MSSIIHSFLMILAISLAYVWLSIPSLEQHSVQAFAVIILLYFVWKRLKKPNAEIWHILPENNSEEMALITFGFLLLVGDTGNLQSLLFPLTYIHLFFLVLSSETATSLTAIIGILLFHFGLSTDLPPLAFSNLASIPIVSVFFMFARHQYHRAWKEQLIIEQTQISILSPQDDTQS